MGKYLALIMLALSFLLINSPESVSQTTQGKDVYLHSNTFLDNESRLTTSTIHHYNLNIDPYERNFRPLATKKPSTPKETREKLSPEDITESAQEPFSLSPEKIYDEPRHKALRSSYFHIKDQTTSLIPSTVNSYNQNTLNYKETLKNLAKGSIIQGTDTYIAEYLSLLEISALNSTLNTIINNSKNIALNDLKKHALNAATNEKWQPFHANDTVTNIKLALARDAIDTSIEKITGLDILSLTNIEFEYELATDGFPQYKLHILHPVYTSEQNRHNAFVQGSIVKDEDRTTFNAGTAYRYLTENEKYLLGINSFVDYQLPFRHSRASIGFDAKSRLFGVSANRYLGLSGWHASKALHEERPLGGFDVELSGRLDRYPSLEVFAKYFTWYTYQSLFVFPRITEDIKGQEYRAEFTPYPIVTLKGAYTTSESEALNEKLEVGIQLNYTLGESFKKQTTPVPNTKKHTIHDRIFEKVRREDAITVQERLNVSLVGMVIRSDGSNFYTLNGGPPVQIFVGDFIPFGALIMVSGVGGDPDIVEILFGDGARLIIAAGSTIHFRQNEIELITGMMRYISGGVDRTLMAPGGTITLLGTDTDVRDRGDGCGTTVRLREGRARMVNNAGNETFITLEILQALNFTTAPVFITLGGSTCAVTHTIRALIELDQIIPTVFVTDTNPADNDTGIATNTDITITFSEDITASVGNITITDNNDGSDNRTIPIGDAQISILTNVLTLNPATDFEDGTNYIVTLPGGIVQGTASSSPSAAAGFNFTTTDLSPPNLASVNSFDPDDDATGVPITSNLVIRFDENIMLGTAGLIQICTGVCGAGGDDFSIDVTSHGGQLNVLNNEVTINPTSDLAENTSYFVNINAGAIEDLSGNDFAGILDTITWNFTTIDNAPLLLATSPIDNTTAVARNTNLILTFDQDVAAGTGNIIITDSTDASDNRTIAIGDAQVSIAGNLVTIDPSTDLEDNSAYDVTIASGVIEDTSSNAFTGITTGNFNFSTADNGPVLTATTPIDDATAVARNTNLILTFDQNVQAGTGNVIITDTSDASDNRTIAIGDAQVSIAGNLVTINPSTDLEDNTAYDVTIASGVIEDTSSNAFAGITTGNFNFSTVDNAPLLLATTPADNATAIARNTNLILTFDQNVAAGTGNIIITDSTDASDNRTIAIGDAQVSIAGNLITINPSTDLEDNSDYDVTITSGVIEDTSSNAFAGITTGNFNFSTADAGPILTATTPIDDATAVARNTNLILTFDQNVQAGTGNIIITDTSDASDNRTIAIGDAQVSIAGNLVTIDLTTDLEDNSNYDVTIASGVIEDTSSNAFAGITTGNFNFSTVNNAPLLLATTPADNATAIARNTNLILTFDQNVAAGAGNIIITDTTDASDNRTIAIGDAQVSIAGNLVTINPSTDLEDNSDYDVTIASGVIEDLTSNAFAGITTGNFNFSTIDNAPLLLATTPTDNATAIARNTNLILTFDQNVAAGTGNIIITDTTDASDNRTIAIGDAQVSIAGNLVTINPSTDLEDNSDYDVTIVSGVIEDTSSNAFAGITTGNFNFSTADTGPVLTATTPTDDTTAVARNTNLILTFDQNIQAGTGNIVITDTTDASDNRTIAIGDAQVSIAGNLVTIDLTTDLEDNSAYDVTIASGVIEDTSSNAFAGITTGNFNFSTADTGPVLTATTPTDDTTAVARNTNLILTFDQNIAAGTGNIVITDTTDASDNRTIAIGDAQVSIAGNLVTIDLTTDLEDNSAYDITIASGVIEDLTSNAFAGITTGNFNFSTIDNAPLLLATTPADNDTDVARNTNFILTFDQDIAAGTGNIVITDTTDASDNRTIAIGDAQVSIAGNLVTIDLTTDLEDNSAYDVTIASGVIEDTSSNAFAGITTGNFNFSTIDNAPLLLATTPADNDTDVARNTNLILTFDQDIAAGTGNIVITDTTDASDNRTIAIGDAQVSIAGNLVTIDLTTDLEDNSAYDVTIASGVIEDLTSNAFAGITTGNFNFSTIDNAPLLLATTPADDATGVVGSTNLILTFDQNVAAGTGNIVITDTTDASDNRTIAIGDAQVTIAGNLVTLDLTADLEDNSDYDVTIVSGVIEDTTSNDFAGITTGNFNFSVDNPPLLTATTPADDDTNASSDTNLILTFDQNVAAGTGNIVITDTTDASDNRTIAIGDAQVSIASNLVTIDPSTDLEDNTAYDVTIVSGVIEDTTGNDFAGITTGNFNFTTTAPTVTASHAITGKTDGDSFELSNGALFTASQFGSGLRRIQINNLGLVNETIDNDGNPATPIAPTHSFSNNAQIIERMPGTGSDDFLYLQWVLASLSSLDIFSASTSGAAFVSTQNLAAQILSLGYAPDATVMSDGTGIIYQDGEGGTGEDHAIYTVDRATTGALTATINPLFFNEDQEAAEFINTGGKTFLIIRHQNDTPSETLKTYEVTSSGTAISGILDTVTATHSMLDGIDSNDDHIFVPAGLTNNNIFLYSISSAPGTNGQLTLLDTFTQAGTNFFKITAYSKTCFFAHGTASGTDVAYRFEVDGSNNITLAETLNLFGGALSVTDRNIEATSRNVYINIDSSANIIETPNNCP